MLLDALTIENDTSGTNGSGVNWQDEVAFTESIPRSITTGKVRHTPGGIEAALTGATGFLGRHILQELVNHPAVKMVHCIAVRDASKSLIDSPKVIVHLGDLKDARLGLPPRISQDASSLKSRQLFTMVLTSHSSEATGPFARRMFFRPRPSYD